MNCNGKRFKRRYTLDWRRYMEAFRPRRFNKALHRWYRKHGFETEVNPLD